MARNEFLERRRAGEIDWRPHYVPGCDYEVFEAAFLRRRAASHFDAQASAVRSAYSLAIEEYATAYHQLNATWLAGGDVFIRDADDDHDVADIAPDVAPYDAAMAPLYLELWRIWDEAMADALGLE